MTDSAPGAAQLHAGAVALAARTYHPITHERAVVLLVIGVGLILLVAGFVWGAINRPRWFPTNRLRGDTQPRGPRTVLAIRGVLVLIGAVTIFGAITSIVVGVQHL